MPEWIDGFPYLIARAIGTEIISLTLSKSLYESTIRGDPSSHHIFLYALADFFGLKFKIIPFTRIVLSQSGSSMTLSSIKNSFKYFFTSLVSVLSGEPRLTIKAPFILLD